MASARPLLSVCLLRAYDWEIQKGQGLSVGSGPYCPVSPSALPVIVLITRGNRVNFMHLHLSSIKNGFPLAVAQLSMAAVEGSRVTACVRRMHPQHALTPPIHSACLSSTRGSSLISEAHGLLSCLLQSMPQDWVQSRCPMFAFRIEH